VSPVNAAAFAATGAAAIYRTARRKKAKGMYKLGRFKLSSRLLVGGLISATLITMGFMIWVNLSPPLY